MTVVYPEYICRIYDALRRVRQGLPWTGYPVQRGEPYRPFFIIGSGRAGTTLLRRVLNSHPQLHIPPENHALPRAIAVFRRNAGLRWPDLVGLMLGQFAFDAQSRVFQVPLEPLFDQLCSRAEGERSLALILHSFYVHHARKYDKADARWGDKTPMNTFYLDRIHSVFPRSQFVHIIRDGCDVVASMLRQGRYDNLEAASERWKRSVRAARRFGARHPGKVLEVRYEQFVTDPETVVRGICRFLGIPFDGGTVHPGTVRVDMPDVTLYPHLANVANPISAGSIGKGRRELSQAEKDRLELMIGPQLASLGYDSCTS